MSRSALALVVFKPIRTNSASLTFHGKLHPLSHWEQYDRFWFNYIISKIFVEKQIKLFKRRKSNWNRTALLKDCALISGPLCHIMNLSIKSGTVPRVCKVATITLLLKSGDSLKPENYRPISNSGLKILEKAVHGKLMTYLEKWQSSIRLLFG